jgi:FKBP-type peptidyl-prolyl cis-trans isomerase FkpA
MKKILMAATAAIALASCGSVDYDKAPSGMVYKIIPGKGGDSLLKAGDYIKFNLDYVLTDRQGKADSVLNPPSTMPGYLQVDSVSKRSEYSFMEILTKLRAGDSAVTVLNIDSLKSKGARLDSTVFTKGSSIQCRFRIIKSFKQEKDVRADYDSEIKSEEAREVKSLEDYMTKNNLKGIKTKNGAYVILDNPGDASLKADSGKIASVKYRGYLMSDKSKIFDTNMDSSKGHTEPYDVPVGRRSVIPGWDEGLPYFGKGGTGKILVPSFLGYGPQGNGPDLPPNANLVFDIQIVDVKDAPPMQQMDPRQMQQQPH